ncbi:MAG: PEGA domain-containing protein [Polyangiaceae bacterium]|nr:PEGA domain-containing protein [Polyangiaceae bacterium]
MASSNSEISTSENEEGSGELFADLPVKSKRAQGAPAAPPSAPKSQATSAASLVSPPSGQARPVMQSSSGVHSLASAPPPPPPSRVSAPPPSRVSAPPPVPSSVASTTATSAAPPPPPSLRGAAPPPSAPPPPTRSEIEAAPLEHVEYVEDQGDEATPVRPQEGTPTVKLPDVSIVAAMTRGGTSAAPPPPPTPAPISVPPAPAVSAPVPSVPVPSVPGPMSVPPVSAPPPVSTMPVLSQPVVVHQAPAPSGNNKLIVGALVLLALVAAGLVYQQFAGGGAKEGTLLANVSGPGGTAVDKFELFVDGSRRCEASPCKVDGLTAGEHFVKVVAPGFESSAAVSVNIEGGQTRTHSIELVPDKSAKPTDEPAKADAKTDSKADSAKEDSAKDDTLSVDQLGDKRADEKADTKATAKADTKTAVKGAAAKGAAKGAEKGDDKGAAASNEQGTIHISSTPPSNVVVDGKPIGMTPKSVKVAPGPHTIVFIGPEGRKVQGVNVKPGGTHSASVTF